MPVPREKLCRIAHITMDIFDRDVLAPGPEAAPPFTNQSSIVSDETRLCTIEHPANERDL
jgi:hypothetical protein